jgi:HAE1 family hydrophobic/amphiphilic exporter-1
MSLTRVFIKRPTLAFVLVVLTLLAGFQAFRSLVVQEMPNTSLPAVNINVQYSGASTSELRDSIVRPIEDQLSGTPNLDHLDATIQTGSASITASFALTSSDTENLSNVQKALQTAQRQLPTDLTAPTIRTADPSQPVVISLALTSKKYPQTALAAIANDQIVPAVEQVPGVSNVQVYGQTQAAYEVTVDPALLAASNLTITDVMNAIGPNNVRAPGGIVYQPGRETQIDVRGDIASPADVANLPIHVAASTSSGTTGGTGTTSAGGAGSGGSSSGGGASSSGSSSGGGASSSGGGGGSSSGGGGSSGDGASGSTGTGASAASGGGTSANSTGGTPGRARLSFPRGGATTPPLSVNDNVPQPAGPIGVPASGATLPPAPALASSAPAQSQSGSNGGGQFGTAAGSSAGGNSAGGTGAGGGTSGGSGTTAGASGTSTGAGATSGTSASGGGTSGVGAGGSSAAGGSSSSGTNSSSTSSSGTGTGTGAGAGGNGGGTGTSGAAGGGFSGASSANGGSTTGGTNVGSTPTSSVVTSSQASARPPVDQPITVSPPSVSTSSTAATPAMPNVSSVLSGGAGTSTSPFVGGFDPWSAPSANKRVSDVASVKSGSVPQRVFSSIDGKNGIALNVQKATTASEVTVADAIEKNLPKLQAQFPDIDFAVQHVQATYTREQLTGVERTLLEGVLLTAVVMLFFLKSWRNAVVVMIAIPTSLGVTLFAMHLLNLTLDTISLLAMTLVIGILIDDSTVVLENVERHHAMGEEPPDAALNGRGEIGLAAIVITLVDVVVFLPIAFAGGPVGRQLSEFGIVVSVATLTSLFVSFTITPALAGLWSLKSSWKPWPVIERFDRGFNGLRKRYAERWLPATMHRPWPVLIVSVILCVVAVALVPLGIVGEEYIPQGDQAEIFADYVFAPGTPLATTQGVMERAEAQLKQIVGDDLESEATTAGGYAAPFGGFVQEGNAGEIHAFLNQNHKTATEDYVNLILDALRKLAPDAQLNVKAASAQGGGPRQPIDVLVQTANGEEPGKYSARIAAALRDTPGAASVTDSGNTVAPQVEVQFDRVAAQSLDASIGTAASAIRAAFGGAQATQIETADRGLTEIEVIFPRAAQKTLSDVLQIPIRAQSGAMIHVGDIAHLQYAPAALLITRENRADVVHVSANVAPGYQLSNVARDFTKRWQKLKLPKSVTVHPTAQGQQDLMGQTLKTLGLSLVASFVLVFLMIVALYNSYRTPFVTLFAIPLATIGAFGALALTHQTLNLYSLIGIVLLVGLVTKNGILLVDFADTVRKRDGKSRDDAIRESASTRFRPIMMTTIAMVAGMLPLALGLDPGGSQRKSLGIAVIGGLLSSLVLTLVIVPIMYHWLAPKKMAEETKLATDDERRDKPGKSAPQPA